MIRRARDCWNTGIYIDPSLGLDGLAGYTQVVITWHVLDAGRGGQYAPLRIYPRPDWCILLCSAARLTAVGERTNLSLESLMPDAARVLDVEDLTVRLGAVEVIRDLSFHADRGSSVAIIGPNGAGKSVLLRALVGALPYTGVIRWGPSAVLGYVPQKLDIERDLPLSGRDFLRARAVLLKVSSTEITDALRRVALTEQVLSQPIGTLSGGQFQRLLVAFALLGHPNVLLLDEAAAGVDAPGQIRLNAVIKGLQRTAGMTVLLVSHDLSVVYRYADQVLCLGRHISFGPPRVALTPETLSELYGAPVTFHVHDRV